MKIKDFFEICPICKGKSVVLNYNIKTLNDMEIVECTHCFYGIIIKDDLYDKIVDKFKLNNE